MSSNKQNLNINEASKLCGLSPSVLRIWELRYGWPAPKRKPNGYRAYNQHQVQELKRMAELVKAGIPVSSLIVDGLPRWPANHAHHAGPVPLPVTRALAAPDNRQSQTVREELIEALETRRSPLVKEALQRGMWSVHHADELRAVLAPALVGLAELRRLDRTIADEDEIRSVVRERALQLLRKFRAGDDALGVVPASESDQALAAVLALLLHQRGHPARPHFGEVPDAGHLLVASDDDSARLEVTPGRVVGRLSSMGGNDAASLAELVGAEHSLPWHLEV